MAESQALEPEKGWVVKLYRKIVELFNELEIMLLLSVTWRHLKSHSKQKIFRWSIFNNIYKLVLTIFDDNITTVDDLFNCLSSFYDLFHTALILEEIIDRFDKKRAIESTI